MPTDFLPDKIPSSEINTPDSVIARNLRILERAFIPNLPELNDPDEEEIAHFWLNKGETRSEGDDTLMSAINIRFDTKTGKIIKKPNIDNPELKDGDISVLNTFLIADGERVDLDEKKTRWNTTPGVYKILLAYPKDWLTPHSISAAINQTVDELVGEGNWILPERIIPERIREHGWGIAGDAEPWGQSRFMENPADKILFETIEEFNKKYGPSLSEQFFRGLKTISAEE